MTLSKLFCSKMWDFKFINLESIKLRIGSFIGSVFTYNKEEHQHDEKTLIAVSKTHTGDYIEKQLVVKLPEGSLLTGSQRKELIEAALGGEQESEENEAIPASAGGGIRPPLATTNKRAEDFLQRHLKENQSDNNLLLDRGGLFLIYREREAVSFTEEELVFLVWSSIKQEFPLSFWSYYYRETFGNVVPLFQRAFHHPSSKVRRGVIDALSDFADTEDDMVKLAEDERDPHVLGFIASNLLEKESTDSAQRVIANALTRKIIPILTEKSKSGFDEVKIDLGAAEKRLLHDVIDSGWPEEKSKALTILSLSAEETDLPILENLFEKMVYTDISILVLNCIKRIGKTSKAKDIEKELIVTKSAERFTALLDTLAAVGYKVVFPQLLKWLRDMSIVANRLWRDDTNKWALEEKTQSAISSLLDKDTYELLVQYILEYYSPDEYGNIMSWRHFGILKDQKNNSEIVSLIKAETRLTEFEKWQEVILAIELEGKINTENKEQLLSFVTIENTDHSLFVLRKLYEIITPAQAFVEVTPLIEQFRTNLNARLQSITKREHPEEVKEIAENNLENFLGENKHFYRLDRKRREGSRHDIEGEEDRLFETLIKDIHNFDYIERDYLTQIFKSKSPDVNSILMDGIGRPFECIYENLEKDTDDTERLRAGLSQVIENHPNPLVKLKAIEAALRIEVIAVETLRETTLSLLQEAKEKVKSIGGEAKNKVGNDWFVHELTYLWALNVLTIFGVIDDFPLMQEATNREKIIARNYNRYSYFFDHAVFEELLNLTESLEDDEERKSALSSLNSLDFMWAKKYLQL